MIVSGSSGQNSSSQFSEPTPTTQTPGSYTFLANDVGRERSFANVQPGVPLVVGENDHVAILSYSIWFGSVLQENNRDVIGGTPVYSRWVGEGQAGGGELPETGFYPARSSKAPFYPTTRWVPDPVKGWVPGANPGYHSADPALIEAHYKEILGGSDSQGMGFDAIMVDITNGLTRAFERSPELFVSKQIHALSSGLNGWESHPANTVAVYENFNRLGAKLKIVPSLGAQCDGGGSSVESMCSPFDVIDGDSLGRSAVQRGLDFFIMLQEKYPGLSVVYEGKPLLLTFSGPVLFTEANARFKKLLDNGYYQDTYNGKIRRRKYTDLITIRQKGGVLSNQGEYSRPSVRYSPLSYSTKGMWSYYERWSPAMGWYPTFATVDKLNENSRVEAFAASMGSWGAYGYLGADEPYKTLPNVDKVRLKNWGWWNAETRGSAPEIHPTATPRHGGATFREQMRWARKLKPTFLIITRYNEFSFESDDGWSEETSMNIESTAGPKGYGDKYVRIVRQELQKYFDSVTGVRAESAENPDFKITGYVDPLKMNPDGSYIISGWACSRGFETSVSVELQIGNTRNSIGEQKASLTAEQAVSDACKTEHTPHRFQFTISSGQARLYAGQSLWLKAKALHGLGVEDSYLTQSGKLSLPLVTCDPATKPASTQTAVTCASLLGATYAGNFEQRTNYVCEGLEWKAVVDNSLASLCTERRCPGEAPAGETKNLNCQDRDSTKTGTYQQTKIYQCNTSTYTWQAVTSDDFTSCQNKPQPTPAPTPTPTPAPAPAPAPTPAPAPAPAPTPVVSAPKPPTWNTAASNDELWPAKAVVDGDANSCYSSNGFESSDNNRNVFIAAWLNPGDSGPSEVDHLILTARMISGTPAGFPKSYTVYVTAPDNSRWDYAGDFDVQPDGNGKARINFGKTMKTYGFQIVPKVLGADDYGGHYFQLCGLGF